MKPLKSVRAIAAHPGVESLTCAKDLSQRYRRAYPRLFRHPAFKKLPPLGQRLTLYILFGPQSNRIGLFYFSINTAAEDLDTTPESLKGKLAGRLP